MPGEEEEEEETCPLFLFISVSSCELQGQTHNFTASDWLHSPNTFEVAWFFSWSVLLRPLRGNRKLPDSKTDFLKLLNMQFHIHTMEILTSWFSYFFCCGINPEILFIHHSIMFDPPPVLLWWCSSKWRWRDSCESRCLFQIFIENGAVSFLRDLPPRNWRSRWDFIKKCFWLVLSQIGVLGPLIPSQTGLVSCGICFIFWHRYGFFCANS